MIKHNMKTPKSGVNIRNGEFVILGVQGEVIAKFGTNENRARKVCEAMNREIERHNANC
jgi:hypothetical protein